MTTKGKEDLAYAVGVTLGEALAAAAPEPTLVWGGIGLATPLSKLPDEAACRVFSWDARTPSELSGTGRPCSVGVIPDGGAERRIVVRLPGDKALLDLIIGVAAERLPPGGELWVAGHKREGIRSAEARLEAAIGPCGVRHLKRRCRVLVATRSAELAASAFDLESLVARYEVPLGEGAVVVHTLPGVFAHGRFDEGSERLLRVLRYHKGSARVLDLGCGGGALGAFLAARHSDSHVDLVDASALAHDATCRTLAANRLENAHAHLADVADAPSGRYQLIVSNPPFHEGRQQDTSLIERFADAAAARLTAGGRFLVVANTHLPYAAVLKERFRRVGVRHEDAHYRVWEARP